MNAATRRLCGYARHFGSDDRDKTAALATVLELYDAVNLRIERVVGAATYIEAGLMGCATLTNDDGAAGDYFSGEALYAKPLSVRVAAVLGRSESFLCAIPVPLSRRAYGQCA